LTTSTDIKYIDGLGRQFDELRQEVKRLRDILEAVRVHVERMQDDWGNCSLAWPDSSIDRGLDKLQKMAREGLEQRGATNPS
jgi:hypothetical protein